MGDPRLSRGPPTPAAVAVYKPRRAAAFPLFRLLQDRFPEFHACYEERFAHTYGDWRPVLREVAEKFLACGILAHGFARVRCESAGCGHEYLVAFSCKARYFCPSCHAKRLALWTLWLEETLLEAAVPHRQVVLTIPKRLRAWCLYRRRLLGDVARVAARTVTAAVRTLTQEPELAVGIVACIQTHGSRANSNNRASAHSYDRHRRRLSARRHVCPVARTRHGGPYRSLSARSTPGVRAARRIRGRGRRRDAGVGPSGPTRGFTCTTPSG